MPSPARIAVLFEFPTISGGESAALEILRRLDRARHDAIAMAPEGGSLAAALRADGIPHAPLTLKGPEGNPPPAEAIRRVACVARRVGAAILHANALAVARYGGPAGEELGIPTLAHCRDIQRLSAANARDVGRNRRLVAVSKAVASFLSAQGIPPDRIELIPDGVDLARVAAGRRERLRAELNLAPGTPVVGAVGQILPRKGQDVLVEAAAKVLTGLPEAVFLLVGSRFSRKQEVCDYEKALHRRVAQLGLGERVRFLGQREDMPDVLAAMDVFVHPANEEPQSIAVLEAMAARRPVVATAVGGTPELIEDGESGLLVPPKDPDTLARAIMRLLRDRPLATRLAEAGRTRAACAFRPADTAARIAALYDALLAKGPRPGGAG